MGWTKEGSEFSPGMYNNFFFSTHPAWFLGPTQPPIQWVNRPQREADHSSANITEIKNTRIYTFTPQYVVMEEFLIWSIVPGHS
jgi:hypothetical protein